ncbi:EamA family transporter [Mycolicibacterium fortuitum]
MGTAGKPHWALIISALLVLGTLWGSAFPLIKVAAPAFGPVGTTHIRLAVAAVVLALLAAVRRDLWRGVHQRFGAFALLAALNVAIPLTLVATAIVGLNASMAAILNATTPMFTILVAAAWLGQRVTWRPDTRCRRGRLRRCHPARRSAIAVRYRHHLGRGSVADRSTVICPGRHLCPSSLS